MNIKNVIVIDDYNYIKGGSNKVAIDTANLLLNLGLNVIFFCGVERKDAKDLNQDVTVVSVDKTDCLNSKNKISGFFRNLSNPKAKKKLKKLLKSLDKNETIVHIHGWTKDLSSSIIKPCKKLGFKVVLTAHDYFSICPNGILYNFKKSCVCTCKPMGAKCVFTNCDSRNYPFKLYRVLRQFFQNTVNRFVKRIDAVFTISDLNELLIKDIFKHAEIYRLHNPIKVNNCECVNIKNNHNFVFVGRLCKEKGIEFLCETFSKTEYPLNIIGDGPLKIQLEEKYKQKSNIHFLGWKSAEETLDIIRKSKMLIFPSLWYEASPLVVLEALSQGVPCVVSSISAASSFVSWGGGSSFNVNDAGSLLNAIEKVEKEIETFSKNAYNWFWHSDFTPEKYVENILKLYNKVLSKSKS